MKIFFWICFTLSLLSCGVATDSSKGQTGTDPSNPTDIQNPDNNESVIVPIEDGTESGFTKDDAIHDLNACLFNDVFSFIEDSSFDPNSVADAANGVEIASQYPYTSDLEATKVVLFYPQLSLLALNSKVHIYEENYRLSVDKAWAGNELKYLYVRTPKSTQGFYSCYRYDVSSTTSGGIVKTKVYR